MVIGVKFKENYRRKAYDSDSFYYNCDIDVAVGDAVIVETRYGITLGMVAEINVINYTKTVLKEVVCKIDLSEYAEKKKREIRLKTIKAKLDAELAAVDEYSKYDQLAKLNPNLADLVNEYKTSVSCNNIVKLNEINITNEELINNDIKALNE